MVIFYGQWPRWSEDTPHSRKYKQIFTQVFKLIHVVQNLILDLKTGEILEVTFSMPLILLQSNDQSTR